MKKINNWEVTNSKPFRKYGRYYITVRCTCGSGIKKDLLRHHLTTEKSKGCMECSRGATFKGYEMISGEFWALIKSSAEKREIPFEITIEEAWDKFDGKCSLTGLPIKFESRAVRNRDVDTRKLRTASLDRINSSRSYAKDNVQWVHKDVNIMKNRFPQEYFINVCKLISNKNESKN